MEEVQNKILEIAVYLDELCTTHNITYYLMGGSALGAVRHQGFIPWDDDLDVFMTYDNYIKFIKICETHLDTEKYYLQKENTEEWPLFFTKLRMNGTTFIEEDTKNREMHKGFYVDIMCLNNTTKNPVIRYIQYFSARLIVVKTLSVRGYITESRLKKISMLFSSFVIRGVIFDALLWIVRGLNNRNTEYIGHFFGRAKFKNTSFPKKLLGTPKYVKFSCTELPVMEEVKQYLEIRYGEKYMDMPDQKTMDLYPAHAYFIDTKVDYKEYE